MRYGFDSIKVGSKVVIVRPQNEETYPGWTTKMNQYAGIEITVRDLYKPNGCFSIEEDDGEFIYSNEWVIDVINNDEEIEIDSSPIDDLIVGFGGG